MSPDVLVCSELFLWCCTGAYQRVPSVAAEGIDGYERLYLEIPTGAAASAEVSGTMFEGLVQSLLECTLGGEGRRDIRGLQTRKIRYK